MSNFTTWRSLVDGEEIGAIPDSAVARYDATEEESTGVISTIDDLVGSFDLSGDGEVISSGINGLQTYRLDGSQSFSTSDISVGTPNATIIVFQFQNLTSSQSTLYDSDSEDDRRQIDDDDGGGTYRLFHGDSTATGGSTDTAPHIALHIANDNTTDDILEIDGSEVINANVGDGSFDGYRVGADRNDSDNAEVDFGEIVHYDNPTDSTLSSEVDRMADKWGFTF